MPAKLASTKGLRCRTPSDPIYTLPARPVNTVVWYLNDVVQGVRDFENVGEARHWAVNTLWTALPMGQRCHH